MRWQRSLGAIGALALWGGGALAEPATPEGAKAIEQSYAAYFSQGAIDKGILSVEPQGEGYLVSWNVQKALDAAGAPKGGFQVDNFTYVVTPGPNATWAAKTLHFPQVAFDVPTDKGQAKGVVAFDGFHLETVYDPQADEFLRSTGGADNLTGAFHIAEGAQITDFKVSEDALTGETRAKPSATGDGIDVAIAQAFKNMTETILAPPSGGTDAPIQMTYNIGGLASGATLEGLRAKEIGEFWKYVVAHAAEPGAPPAIQPLLKSMMPLWTKIHADAKLDDLKFVTPFGAAALKTLGESLDLTGFTASGIAEIGVELEDLSVTSVMLPAWVSSLSPASFDLKVRLTGEDWDKAAQLALDDPHFAQTGDVSPEVGEEIKQVLLAGHPKVVLTPGHFKIPALDLAFEGEAAVTPDAPSAHFNISADGLDKTIALLQDLAKAEPDAQNALLGVTFLKGLATTGADGRLVWDIVTDGAAVIVNGSPLPTGP